MDRVSPALKATVTPGSRASRLTLEHHRGLIPPPGSLPGAPCQARLRQRTGTPGTWPRGVRYRSPHAQQWTAWTPQASAGRLVTLRTGHAGVWYQVTGVQGDRVRFELQCLFAASGEELVSPNELRFRTPRGTDVVADRRRLPGGACLR